MNKAVLIVGGAGYVGSHTCKVLASNGILPVVYDNLSTGHRDFVRWGPLVEGHMHDREAIAETLDRFDIDAVIHFAAAASVGESVVNPEKYYLNNVTETLSLLQALRAASCTKVVFSSSCAIYGEPSSMPITENERPWPINPYGKSKIMVEEILADYSRAYGFQSISLRYFNASGADPDGLLGELRHPETHLIPRAMMTLQGHLTDFAVLGSDFDTPDGTAVRDYIHVMDLAAAHVLALDTLNVQQPGARAYNLGTGCGHSVKEVLLEVERVAGRQLPVKVEPRRAGDPAILVADPSRSTRELGFVPVNSALSNIVETSWKWHRVAHPMRSEMDFGAPRSSGFEMKHSSLPDGASRQLAT